MRFNFPSLPPVPFGSVAAGLLVLWGGIAFATGAMGSVAAEAAEPAPPAFVDVASVLAPGGRVVSGEWSWRALEEGGWSRWRKLGERSVPAGLGAAAVLDLLQLRPPSGAAAVELRCTWLEEEGPRRGLWMWRPSGAAPAEVPTLRIDLAGGDASAGTSSAKTETGLAAGGQGIPSSEVTIAAGDTSSVSGHLFYRDRIFDLAGYTGATRLLPLRHVRIELVRAGDDSLVAVSATDGGGSFDIAFDLGESMDLRLRLVSRIEDLPGPEIRVLDEVPAGGDLGGAHELIRDVILLTGLEPGVQVQLGELALSDDEQGDTLPAFNVLDCLLDAAEMLEQESWLALPPTLPPAVWSPDNDQMTTIYEDGVVRVASPGGGDDDAWADELVLAALGQWFVTNHSRVDAVADFSFLAEATDPRRAFGDGSALVFASLVRAHRAATRVDRDGDPADDGISVFADLGLPPPLGFPGSAQDGLDLETRERTFGGSALPRGQSSVANVAAMLWDLVDDTQTPDGLAGDDDPRDEAAVDGAARWAWVMMEDLPQAAGNEVITYEDFHEAWRARWGEDTALDSIAVAVGRTALFTDAFEVDDTPQEAVSAPPWHQPTPEAGRPVVVGEVFLGDGDWVELSNPSTTPIAMGGWRVIARRDGFSVGSEREAILPEDFVLRPGRSVVVHEGGDPADDTFFDLFFPDWSAPWQEGYDGACILEDASGTAVDFVRWDGLDDPSDEPVPPGLVFTGALASPAFGRTLGRDSVATDTDDASDFQEMRPSPRAPNGPFLALHTLRPATDLDHLRLSFETGRLGLILAAAEREEVHAELTLMDSLGLVLEQAEGLAGDEGSVLLQYNADRGDTLLLRLQPAASCFIATAVNLGAWVPWDDTTLLPVEVLHAVTRNEDPLLDTVDVSWTNGGVYDSLKVTVDGALAAILPGDAESWSTQLEGGHHRLAVNGRLDGFDGPAASTGIFVGVTACVAATGFEDDDSLLIHLDGFAPVELPYSGSYGLLDHGDPWVTYPPADTSTVDFDEPIDLTSTSRLDFVHAAHLVDGDWGLVELSEDDGVDWVELARYTGSDHDGSEGGADWTDMILQPQDWVHESLDLSAWAGRRVRLRFRRVSAPDGGGNLGWLLDDVVFGNPLHHVLWVAPDGDDVFGCGAQERPLATFARAAELSAPADTIHLAAGTYTETTELMLDGSLRPVVAPLPPSRSLVGDGVEQTILQIPALGTGIYAGDVSSWTEADSGLVQGVSLRGGSRGVRVEVGCLAVHELRIDGGGTAMLVSGGRCEADGVLIRTASRAVRQEGGILHLHHATITELDRGIFVEVGADSFSVDTSIFTRIHRTAIEVAEGGPQAEVACNDFYGFSGSPDVFLGLDDPVGQNGNVALPVEFCDPFDGDDYHLAAASPLLDLPGCGRVGALGEGCANPVVDVPPARPAVNRLVGNHPNPFNPRTRIVFETAREGFVRLEVVDPRGRLVRTLVAAELAAGSHSVDWDARDLHGNSVASGVYRLRLVTGGELLSRPVVLLK